MGSNIVEQVSSHVVISRMEYIQHVQLLGTGTKEFSVRIQVSTVNKVYTKGIDAATKRKIPV